MSQTIKLKRSAVAGKVPTTSSLDLGEVAINTNDGKVFLKKDDGTQSIQTVVTTNSLTTGSINLTGAVSASYFTGSFTGDGANLDNVRLFISGVDLESNNVAATFSKLHFDSGTGIYVSASDADTAFVELGSHFRDIFVDGSATLVATGSDQLDVIAGNGLDITTSLTDTNSNSVSKELIFAVDNTIATTGSNSFVGNQDITGALTASTAQIASLNYPTSDGTDGQVLTTDGLGNLAFETLTSTTTAQDLVVTGKNKEATDIQKGTPLYFSGSGAAGNVVGIYAADAGNPDRMPAGGVAAETIAPDAEGDVYIYGYISGVDTSAFNGGDSVFVAVGGGYTNVVPTGSALIQKLGNVEKVHPSNGSGVIQGPSWYNDLPNWEEGKIKVGTSDSQPVTSSVVHLDESNGRLGIGTTGPSYNLDIHSGTGVDDRLGLRLKNNGTGDGDAIIYLDSSAAGESDIDFMHDGSLNWRLRTGDASQATNTNFNIRNASNTQILTLEQGGNVGIGTTSPGSILDVAGNTADTYIQVRSQDTSVTSIGEGARVRFSDSAETFLGHVGYLYRSATQAGMHLSSINNLYFEVNGNTTPSMTVTSAGDVGIGTTSPSAKLHVDGDAIITGKVTAQEFHTEFVSASIIYQSGSTKFGDTLDDVHQFTGSIRVSGSGDHYFSDGNVGIGTTSPDAQLHIVNSGNGATSTIKLEDNAREMFLGRDSIRVTGLDGTTPQNLYIQPTGNTAFATTSGNVGIGTTSPSKKLDVRGQVQVMTSDVGYALDIYSGSHQYGGFYLDNTSDDYGMALVMKNTSTGTAVVQIEGRSNSSRDTFFNHGGNVGIGTANPSNRFTVIGPDASTGTIKWQNSGSRKAGFLYSDSVGIGVYSTTFDSASIYLAENDRIAFKVGGSTERMRIDSSGNVGIGTTSPGNKLHVYRNATQGYPGSHTPSNATLQIQDSSNSLYLDGNSIIGTGAGTLHVGNASNTAMNLWTNGVNRLHIEAGGNIGIGTDSPAVQLHISGSNSTFAQVRVEAGADGHDSSVAYSQAGTIKGISGYDDSTDTVAIKYGTFGGNGIDIVSSGNVGIGNTSPSGSLHIGDNDGTRRIILHGANSQTTSSEIIFGDAKGGAVPDVTYAGMGIRYDSQNNNLSVRRFWNGSSAVDESFVNFVRDTRLTSFTSDVEMSGDLTVGGIVTAQEFHTEFVSASIIYQSGSTKFGDTLDDVHQFTGSVSITGSSTFTNHGPAYFLQGDVGIGTTSPEVLLQVEDSNGGGAVQIGRDTGADQYQYINFGGNTAGDAAWQIGKNLNSNNSIGPAKGFYLYDLASSTSRLVVDTSGNVGIGTTSPSEILEVNGSMLAGKSGVASRYKIRRPSDGNSTAAYFGFHSAANNDFGIHNGSGTSGLKFSANNGPFDFYNSNTTTTVFRIEADGDVGIGTTTPSAKLHVVGDAIITGKVTAQEFHTEFVSASIIYQSGSTKFGDTSDDVHEFSGSLRVSGSGDHYFSDGNVGIGTTSPDNKLHVESGTVNIVAKFISSDDTAQIQISDNDTTTYFGSKNGLSYISQTGGTPADGLCIDSSGNVGIGTTSPSAKLEVSGGAILIEDGGGASTGGGEIRGYDEHHSIYFREGGNNETSYYEYGGTLAAGDGHKFYTGGLKASQTLKLQIADDGVSIPGDLTVGGIVTAQEFHTEFVSASIIYQSGSTKFGDTSDDVHEFSGSLRVSGSGDHYFSDGNVGIGTTSPGYKLEVNGSTIKPTSNLLLGEEAFSVSTDYMGLKTTFQSGTEDYMIISGKSDGNTYVSAKDGASSYIRGGGNDSGNEIIVYDSGVTDRIDFDTSTAYFNGNVGIGTDSPDSNLHVFKGSAGTVTANGGSIITAEYSDNGYISVLVPDANESGILFGRPTSSVDGGIIYNNSDTSRGLQFRTAGNSTKMVIDSSGDVGIGTGSPAEKLDIIADSISGLKVGANAAGGATITTYQGSTNSNVRQLEFNVQNFEVNTGGPTGTSTTNAFFIDQSQNVGIGTTTPTNAKLVVAGDISGSGDLAIAGGTVGAYNFNNPGDAFIDDLTVTTLTETSTRELKDNIVELTPHSEIVEKLQPVTYTWKESGEEDFGLIAEDVEEIAPHLVTRNKEGKVNGIKYSKLSVLLLDVVQRQSTLIEDLNKRITKLENERG